MKKLTIGSKLTTLLDISIHELLMIWIGWLRWVWLLRRRWPREQRRGLNGYRKNRSCWERECSKRSPGACPLKN